MRRLSVVLLVALAVAGCKKKDSALPVAGAEGAQADQAGAIKGKVLERLDAPPYSYLKLQTSKGDTWAAVPKADAATGAEVTVVGAMPMAGFESKTLNRKFDVVYFGTLQGQGGGEAAAGQMMPGQGGEMGGGQAGMAAQHAAAAAGPADVGDVKVPKASGADARTVAEIHAQKDKLKEKSVTVRGKVVKYNEGIMNRNWIHLRDGSGSSGKADNDITITTNDTANVGDVVVVKGTVRLDKDFGAGYAYPVIVEEAKVSK